MFSPDIKVEQLNSFSEGCMVEHLGIEITDIKEDHIIARMPVDHRTKQPLGLLHGGASVALAESLGSVASSLLVDLSKEYPVGIEINANHIKSASSGYVTGICRPIHVGRGTHVWEIRITNEKDQLIAVSRLTVAVLKKKD